jgi:hypothetical protein
MRPSVPDVHITDALDTELSAYRSVCGQAVVGLIFGLLSPAALLNTLLWVLLPAPGLVFSVWALGRIRKNPSALAGRKMAWTGLVLSLLMAVAAPTDWFAYRRMVRDEARLVSTAWFRYLRQDEPQKAHQLTAPPQSRQPLDERLWTFYQNTENARRSLETYVESPLVHTLLALGPRADVRFYETAGQQHDAESDYVELCYAVTYEEDGEKKTFFVVVPMLRTKLVDGQAGWRILQATGGVRPEGWESDHA